MARRYARGFCGVPVAAALVSIGCTPATAPEPQEVPAAPAPPVAVDTSPQNPTPSRTPFEVRLVECAWGTVGISAADQPQPYWVLGVVELSSTNEVGGLTLGSVRLLDAKAQSIGRSDREQQLWPVAATDGMFATPKAEFDGQLHADRRLRIKFRARMEDGFAARLKTAPATAELAIGNTTATAKATGECTSSWPTG